MINPNSIMLVAGLRDQGFEGFVTVANLRRGNRAEIPTVPGVYLFMRNCASCPEFLEVGTGGHFKNKDPNVSLAKLADEWVEGVLIVYIGQTGSGSKGTLKKRIGAMIRFGQGARVGHWGGRLVWQLPRADELLVSWKVIREDDPRSVEKELIETLKSIYGGRLPFANLRN